MSLVNAINHLADALTRLSVQSEDGGQPVAAPNQAGAASASSAGAAPNQAINAAPVPDFDFLETADERKRAAEAYTNSLPIRDRLREESWQAYRFAAPVVVPPLPVLTRAQRLAHLDLRPLKIRAQRRKALQDRTHVGDWLSECALQKTMSESNYYVRNPNSMEKASRDLSFIRNVVDLHIAALSDRQLAYIRDIISRVYGVTEKRSFEQFVKDVTGRTME